MSIILQANQIQDTSAKTTWDWLDLLIIPIVLAVGGFFLNRTERISKERAAQQRTQDTVLEKYLDCMSELLMEKHLKSEMTAEGRELARVRTLTAMRRLHSHHNESLAQFLQDASLLGISTTCKSDLDMLGIPTPDKDPIIDLHGAKLEHADLRRVNLFQANLPRAHLSRANLKEAYLIGANLQDAELHRANLHNVKLHRAILRGAKLIGADLTGAKLTGAILIQADLTGADLRGADVKAGVDLQGNTLPKANLKGATMPDGLKYEDWLKDGSRYEDWFKDILE